MSLFCLKFDFSTFFTDFFSVKISVYIASILTFWNKEHCNGFCFLLGEIWLSDWGCLFLHQYQKKLPAPFCGISAAITVFRWEKAAVNLNFQQNLYDNGGSQKINGGISGIIGDLRKITANLKKKFDPGSDFFYMWLSTDGERSLLYMFSSLTNFSIFPIASWLLK